MRHKLIQPRRWKILIIMSCVFLTLSNVVFGVPLSISYSNQENIKKEYFMQQKESDQKNIANSSCIVNGSQYGEGEYVLGAGPCEECICHPPNVVCSMIKCPINSGCITIQLPNKCCPKYKCDCEHKGKLYNNGEKIDTPDESACRVCFCNGGEIVCTSIVCYTRNDCQGYYLPGDCCPKYDNCSSASLKLKSRESKSSEKTPTRNIINWLHSTEQNYNDDNTWKRDTAKSQIQELPTVPNTIAPTLFYPEKEYSQINKSSLKNILGDPDVSTTNLMVEKNLSEPDNDTNIPLNIETDTTVGDLNIFGNSTNSFLGFETNTTDDEEITGMPTNNAILEVTSQTTQSEELFDFMTDVDNSVVITHQNGTETIVDVTEVPSTNDLINLSNETTSTHIEVFNPRELILDTKWPMIEYSTTASDLDTTTEMDYEQSREATTPRAPDKSTVGVPHKLVMDHPPKILEDEINTEIIFTNLEDTTDMFGPNFGHQSYKTPVDQMSIKSNPKIRKINHETSSQILLTNVENNSHRTTESPQIELFNNSNLVDNNTLANIEHDQESISVEINKGTEALNDTYFLELVIENNTECINNSCTNYSELNDELVDSQIESTTPFIIESKILPNQDSTKVVNKKISYPKEYPDEFETIQYGPSLTITKRTYTSIPDVVYTTTTMITLPTLDLIYKADKDIEKYLTENQSTTNKPNNNLSPLRNVSSLNST